MRMMYMFGGFKKSSAIKNAKSKKIIIPFIILSKLYNSIKTIKVISVILFFIKISAKYKS